MDSVGAHQDISSHLAQFRSRVPVHKPRRDPAPILGERGEMVTCMEAIRADAFERGIQQNLLKARAQNGVLRPFVSGRDAAGFAPDVRSEFVVIGELRGGYGGSGKLILKAQDRQFTDGMRKEVDADAQLTNFAGGFEDLAVNSDSCQPKRGRKPTGSCPYDERFHPVPLVFNLLTTSRAGCCSES
jgi:hypothetical protein